MEKNEKDRRESWTKQHRSRQWKRYVREHVSRQSETADKDLCERFEFRDIRPEEAEQTAEIERICFPPNEACSRKMMLERVAKAPEMFLVAVDRANWPDCRILKRPGHRRNRFPGRVLH